MVISVIPENSAVDTPEGFSYSDLKTSTSLAFFLPTGVIFEGAPEGH